MNKKIISPIITIILVSILIGVGLVYERKHKRSPIEPESHSVQAYRSMELVRAPWGELEGQVGLSEMPGVRLRYGPESFDVGEKGNIYLLDTRNRRIIEYSEDGKYLSSFSFIDEASGATQDLLIEGDHLYILNLTNYEVLKYRTTGEFIDKYRFPDQVIQLHARKTIVGIDFDYDSNLVLETADQGFYRLTTEGIQYTHLGKQDPNGELYYIVKRLNDKEGVIEVLRNDGSKVRAIEFSAPPPQGRELGTLSLIGADSSGAIYAEIELIGEQGALVVDKYSSEGVLVCRVDLTDALNFENRLPLPYTSVNRNLRITKEGDIYLLYPSQDYVRIVKYTPE